MPKEAEVTAIDVEPQQAKTNLLGFSASKLGDFFEEIGEKRFRATQVIKWIHQMGECDLDQMTNISKDLRERLKDIAEIKLPEVVSCQDSVDGTRKWLIKVEGGSCIEMVYIPERERGTLCRKLAVHWTAVFAQQVSRASTAISLPLKSSASCG